MAGSGKSGGGRGVAPRAPRKAAKAPPRDQFEAAPRKPTLLPPAGPVLLPPAGPTFDPHHTPRVPPHSTTDPGRQFHSLVEPPAERTDGAAGADSPASRPK